MLSIPGADIAPTAEGAPTVESRTGTSLTQSAIDKVTEWTESSDIVGGVFDTTSANTGIDEGAMTHIESNLAKRLLWLACTSRHHAAELHIKHPYSLMHKTSGADNPLFKAFQEWFNKRREIAEKNGDPFPDMDTLRKWDWGTPEEDLQENNKNANWFAKKTLSWVQDRLYDDSFQRGDYRELCQLINFILGGKVSTIQI